MKRLALPLERIWKTMEDKIECPTELEHKLLPIQQVPPAAFNERKQIGLHVRDVLIPRPPQLRRTHGSIAGREASWYPLAWRGARVQIKEQDNDKGNNTD